MTAAPDFQTPDPSELETALAFLTLTLAEFSESIPTYLDGQDDNGAVRLLADLRQRLGALKDLEAYVATDVAKRLGKGEHKVAGWQVKVHSAGRWTDWRHDDVAFAVCRDLAVDPDTGNIVPEVVQIVDQVRSRLLNCARTEWRLTQLAKVGVDPGDYAKWTKGHSTVQLVEDVTS